MRLSTEQEGKEQEGNRAAATAYEVDDIESVAGGLLAG